MKYVIDEKVCKKHNLTLAETLGVLFAKACDGKINEAIQSLVNSERLVTGDMFSGDRYFVTDRWNDEVELVLLESDKSVPSEDRVEKLVKQMRELFPKGMKVGNSAWRGNVRELKLRMLKFFKLYGEYSDEDILNATKKYVDSFDGNYTYMRIIKYFILKSELKVHQNENGETVQQYEDVSMLANILENPEECSEIKRTKLI